MSFEYADWPLPANVYAGWSTRVSGYSSDVFRFNNIARHVSDSRIVVEENRTLLRSRLIGTPQICWLNQTHSTEVVSVSHADLLKGQDGCLTDQVGVACSVMTADCLPVFFWSHSGDQVAAVHAGWRGLANGILLNALQRFDDPNRVSCGIGPAISKASFEVGDDVHTAFQGSPNAEHCFEQKNEYGKFWCDLPKLAEAQLNAAGVSRVYQSKLCTFREKSRFYSYRRDGVTGRMANLIWKTH